MSVKTALWVSTILLINKTHMLLFLILGLIIGAGAIIFALQNVSIITVTFFSWQLQGSLSLILLLAIATGVLVCILVSIPEVIRTNINFSVLKKINKKLEDENASYKRIVGDVARVSQTKFVETTSSATTSSE